MIVKKIILFILVLIIYFPVLAQSDTTSNYTNSDSIVTSLEMDSIKKLVQNKSVVKPTSRFKYSFSFTGFYAKGTLNSILFQNKITTSYTYKHLEVSNTFQYTHEDQNKVLYQKEKSDNYNIDLFESKRFYLWEYGMLESSKLRQINKRFQSGVGAGFYFYRDSVRTINFSYGMIYDNTSYYNNTFTKILRHSIRLKSKLVFKKIVFNAEYFYKPYVSNFSNYYLIVINSIDFPISKKLSFKLNSQYIYESYNPAKVKGNYTLTMGLSFQNF